MTYLAVKALHFWLDTVATCVCKKSQRSAYPQLVLLAMQCTYYYVRTCIPIWVRKRHSIVDDKLDGVRLMLRLLQLKKHGWKVWYKVRGSGRFWRFELSRKPRLIERFRKFGSSTSKLKIPWRSEKVLEGWKVLEVWKLSEVNKVLYDPRRFTISISQEP